MSLLKVIKKRRAKNRETNKMNKRKLRVCHSCLWQDRKHYKLAKVKLAYRMSHVIWNLLLFFALRLFISFYYMQYWPNIFYTGEKVLILISKVFLRLLNSIKAIFRQETSTALQWKSQNWISRQVLVCLRQSPSGNWVILIFSGQKLCTRIF